MRGQVHGRQHISPQTLIKPEEDGTNYPKISKKNKLNPLWKSFLGRATNSDKLKEMAHVWISADFSDHQGLFERLINLDGR